MNYEFLTYQDREMLAIDLANQLAGELRQALSQNDRVAFAVPGGTSPGPVFDDLNNVDLDWSRVDVMLTDERWVPEDHARSNTGLLRERLLTNRAAAAGYLPLYAPAEEPEGVLAALEEPIARELPLAVVLLGMGADMHTASLFPGADRLQEALSSKAPILLPMRAPGAPEPRITLSAPVLNGALSKHVLIFGEEKRAALEAARGKPALEAPINAVLSEAKVHWAP
ncbi:6-phosphogluconolactonase [Mameliella sediminis]|uniref:6-phosphogluconolactonase n=1 Tax=Mameliella sediminis TaxID=2836866 RepID=UPI001C43F30B|nr:6-phosphogluconolactonase [Mameliella sediminis]MBY6114754.1 6-phosphogluconolactonase [Antarctobacter heliothermus]MBY6144327.1 6-phosphogluconolactonase [Mameliella alba]MBV7392765.1 6-phosphogluconolactonase [Mameliella sediminis]MBY6161382.1 6-phosphogluconolactonase [Mameliella alba]MBY6170152.1 6-phosphogluconolactonase [Mameliella alba]